MMKVAMVLAALVVVAVVAPVTHAQAVPVEGLCLVQETRHGSDAGRADSTVCKESAVSDVVKEGCYKTTNVRGFSGRDLPEFNVESR